MCGIVAILNVKEQTHELREKALKMSQKIRHRGPDWSGIYCGGSASWIQRVGDNPFIVLIRGRSWQ